MTINYFNEDYLFMPRRDFTEKAIKIWYSVMKIVSGDDLIHLSDFWCFYQWGYKTSY